MKPPFAQPNDSESQGAQPPDPPTGHQVPSDFFADEAEFARALQTAFPLEREEMPPLFFQTLHGGSDFSLAPRTLEQTITARVFQRLEMPEPPAPGLWVRPGQRHALVRAPLRVPHALGLSTLFVVLLLGLVVGVQVLHPLRAGPPVKGSGLAAYSAALTQELPWREAAQEVPFTVYWLGQGAANYPFQSLRLHMEQDWAAGPIVESQYGVNENAAPAGRVIVRELQPAVGSTILETVEQGAAHWLDMAGKPAIYIEGRWGGFDDQPLWEYGAQAQLIYSAHGLLFWITVQQPGGSTQQTLENIAASLEQLYVARPHHPQPDMYLSLTVQLAPALPAPKIVGGALLILVDIAEQGAPMRLSIEPPIT